MEQEKLEGSFLVKGYLINEYLDKRVTIREVGTNKVSIATLKKHDASSIYLVNYLKTNRDLNYFQSQAKEFKKNKTRCKEHVIIDYKLSNELLSKSQVASIQSLDDVLAGESFEEIFNIE